MSSVTLLHRSGAGRGHAPATPRDSDAPGLIWRGRSVSHRELRDRIDAIRADLEAGGLARLETAAVEARKDPGTIALVAALRACGIAALVLPKGLGPEARAAVCARAGAGIELCAGPDGLEARTPPECPPSIAPRRGAAAAADTGRAAFVLTTSGSTGVPKGVRLPAASIERFSAWARSAFGIGPGVRVLSYAPLNFDLSLLEIWATLDAGGTAILVEPEQAADAAALIRLVGDEMPDVIQGVPLLYKLLGQAPEGAFAAVRHVIVTGEHAPRSLRERMRAHFPTARFHNVYGSTETNDSFVFSCDADAFAALERLPIGAPIVGTTHRVVAEDGADVVGAGMGELHTATPFAALGYTDPALTEAAFYEREEDGERRWYYRTGDVVERDASGALHLVGRRDFIVKVRGVRTNVKDVEAALEAHPDVELAVVCPVTDAAGETALHGVVQTRPDRRVSTLALRQLCAARLPRTAIPGRFTVTDRPLPRTSTGKPDRKLVAATL